MQHAVISAYVQHGKAILEILHKFGVTLVTVVTHWLSDIPNLRIDNISLAGSSNAEGFASDIAFQGAIPSDEIQPGTAQ